jgi:hypothetical protein
MTSVAQNAIELTMSEAINRAIAEALDARRADRC